MKQVGKDIASNILNFEKFNKLQNKTVSKIQQFQFESRSDSDSCFSLQKEV